MRLVVGWIAFFCLLGCGEPPVVKAPPETLAPAVSEQARAEQASVDRANPNRHDQRKIVVFGDSLTSGFGIGHNEAYPADLQALIDAAGYPYEVINAGVSGDTSAAGARRLDWVLEDRDVAAFVLALGGNDAMRGLPPSEMKKNLGTIIDGVEAQGIPVLLAGLGSDEIPDDRYIRNLLGVYAQLAEERDVTFMPNLLQNVAGVAALNQSDGKHPNAAGARIVAENVWKYLKPMLQ